MDGVLDYSLLFRSVPGPLFVLTPDLRIAEATDAYLQATMRDGEEIVGSPLFEVFPDDPDDPAAMGVHNLRESLERVLRAPHVMAVQKHSIRRPVYEGDRRLGVPRATSAIHSPSRVMRQESPMREDAMPAGPDRDA